METCKFRCYTVLLNISDMNVHIFENFHKIGNFSITAPSREGGGGFNKRFKKKILFFFKIFIPILYKGFSLPNAVI